ncbi:L-glutamate gamma-semialdehyde dehydrogenase [Streptomonospora litoralis]|uniref:L-glutamate gamma-semialdehyde dehydrogenase n=1 Tax=Streptomonospora litoralis TaxID=2498135 RepID=A0A4P6Q9M9_9ACTN|nr:L-glutamate gamma-semialdehyde dehydrogenase [Streptomonospora litoralis]QBI55797.1 1-pyrroline-5-carboxylate dehydrogenase 1 [Streptomonospora litoralis]
MDAVTNVPTPVNEPVLTYAPGSPERAELTAELTELAKEPVELAMTIGGERRMGGGARVDVVQPHKHSSVLGTLGTATREDARAAVAAAKQAAPAWRAMPFDERAAVLLRAADLLAGPWRQRLNAATMLGQSKTAIQAEIDAACELIDFWRFNVSYARKLMAEQPYSPAGQWNRVEQRPLEGFVYAVTPFNFTAIAGNLPTAPALMGNVVVWKPAITQQFSAHLLMRLLEEAGMPPGVINMVTGDGAEVSEAVMADPELAGVHFTGSTRVFQQFWRTVGENIGNYRSYPRVVGETGGKDFIVAHSSADPDVVRTAIVRGAFEFQGQKCSAASRAFVARSVWERIREDLVAEVEALPMGDVTDLGNFLGAVIDRRSFDKLAGVLERARTDDTLEIVAGGTADDSEGYFVRPTVLVGTDPGNDVFRTEYFGPIIAVHVYEDDDYERILSAVDGGSPYALTGAVIATDRGAVTAAHEALRFAAGNFYVNDKPTGSVVGQQPFGGARASGTNDKAGSAQNLARWASPRSIKETFVPPKSSAYPHQG